MPLSNWKRRCYDEALPPRTGLQCAAAGGSPFSHPDQPVPTGHAASALAVVGDFDLQGGVHPAQPNLHGTRVRMAHDVRQCLLHDPVCRHIDIGGNRPRGAVASEVHVQSGPGGPLSVKLA